MPGNIQRRKLLIISDTAVCKTETGFSVFEPVLREVEALAELFDEIVWLGSKATPSSTILTENRNVKIRVVQMPSVRQRVLNPFFVLLAYPAFIFYILKYLPAATHVHTRAPSHPAWLGMLCSVLDKKRTYWHKYAGNWIADKLPFTYQRQRKLLQKLDRQNVKTTVNDVTGNHSNSSIYSFENPCMTEAERIVAKDIADKKDFSGDIKLLFVGGLNKEKGILELLDAIENGQLPTIITEIFIIGSGPFRDTVQRRIHRLQRLKIHMLGVLDRKQLDEYYAQSHVLILPSTSEGFPKVIAEAAAYGCVPVVTNISSISRFIINGKTGFLMPDNAPATITRTLQQVTYANLKQISSGVLSICTRFTYENFIKRIQKEIYPA